jgi:NTE family protein
LVNVATRRALVLAGGGIAGIAWETGVLRGVADESPAAARLLLESDVLVGTSAGAAVAAQIGGSSLDELYDRQVTESSAEIDSGVDVDDITDMFLAALCEPLTPRWTRPANRCSGSGPWRWRPRTSPSPSGAT